MMQSRWRRIALGVLFLVSLWLALWGDKTPTGGLAVATRSGGGAGMAAPASRGSPAGRKDTPQRVESTQHIGRVIAREALIADRANGPIVDLFTAQSWAPPPAPVMIASALEADAAPPLPFQMLGKKRDGDHWEIYLARDGQTFIVREGSSIDEAYKVDRIEPPILSIVHVPSGLMQTLDIGDFE